MSVAAVPCGPPRRNYPFSLPQDKRSLLFFFFKRDEEKQQEEETQRWAVL
jgi:hypothetical protein